jgi:N-acetylglucosaminyldiphosphoundecaprenol N-acetyl-beta-D-mannosaminyltransferase
MKAKDSRRTAHVLGVDVDAVDMEGALRLVATLLRGTRKSYVCVAGVHGIMEAQRDPHLLEVYANAAMTIPDGMPLAWVGRMQGHVGMRRVAGPDLMLEVFRRKEFAETTHFLYGGHEGIATELREKLHQQFPWVKIVGTYAPPFRELSNSEETELFAHIAALKPDIMWVGIGCPKQEIFMARYLPGLKTKLMFGVGAAFDFHTGRIRDCADWIKHSGFQWLHRLLQDPRRLWWRYFRNNPAFLWHITLQMLHVRRSHLTRRIRPLTVPTVQESQDKIVTMN